jgi:hypothetical protein
MDARSLFFLGNRLWWFVGLLVGPIVGRLFGDPIVGVLATGVLMLPVFVVFDTDRPWWPPEVKRLPIDSDGTRSELRKLTLWAAIGLAAGLVVALRP